MFRWPTGRKKKKTEKLKKPSTNRKQKIKLRLKS